MPLSTPRIAGVDVARGLALLGMFSVHVFGAFEPEDSPTVARQPAGGRSSPAYDGDPTLRDVVTDPAHSTSPFDLLHTLGAATALLAAVLLLTRITVVRRALLPPAAAGSMPLTLDTAHVLFLATKP